VSRTALIAIAKRLEDIAMVFDLTAPRLILVAATLPEIGTTRRTYCRSPSWKPTSAR